MELYFLKYNNYYNRRVKKFSTLSEYLQTPYYDNRKLSGVSFNPNDGINTKQIVNISVPNVDYLVVGTTTTIDSRWFIIESKRTESGQYEMLLRRDIFADFYTPIINAEVFIEKATLNDNDPMIFNREDMTVNQIKKGEALIKDISNCAWIVGYVATDTAMTSARSVNIGAPTPFGTKSNFETLWNAKKSNITTNSIIISNGNIQYATALYQNNNRYNFTFGNNITPARLSQTEYQIPGGTVKTNETYITVASGYSSYFDTLDSTFATWANLQTSLSDILAYNGKIVYDSTENKYYRIAIQNSVQTIDTKNITGSLYSALTTASENNSAITWSGGSSAFFRVSAGVTEYTYSLTEVSAESVSYQISGQTKLHDAPYCMFAIPYGACTIQAGSTTVTLTESRAKTIADIISSDIIQWGSGSSAKLYDIQILPYCPMQNFMDANGKITVSNTTNYTAITDANNTAVGYILWAENSRFNLTVPFSQWQVSNVKMSNETEMMRLCSPNWNGTFEFNPARNGGVQSFDIDCEYKPYSPYIHVNPNFKQLYGQDYNDGRGLVCGGEFSLAQVSDAWETYQRENVNYQNIFDRQIQNMEFQQNLQRSQQIVSGISGMFTGAIAGSASGGPLGAIAGGITSGIGASIDYAMSEALRNETLDYTKDMFGYSLGNIQALPDSLTRISAFNNNNKIWPVLEYYTCTDTEKTAMAKKIAYNGMKVGRIGNFSEFLNNSWSYGTISSKGYMKGQLIFIDGIDDDFNFLKEIANEINKGAYFTWD